MKAALATLVERRGGWIVVIGVYLVVGLVEGIPLYVLLR